MGLQPVVGCLPGALFSVFADTPRAGRTRYAYIGAVPRNRWRYRMIDRYHSKWPCLRSQAVAGTCRPAQRCGPRCQKCAPLAQHVAGVVYPVSEGGGSF
ncbi:hypothetical protein V5799_008744 [Amblyomma americanum]|uniref:Uncharacterized protein n=1 Tax=Amblyomma americanum TaxID=6943 RepID=A0AAQ4FCJ6_AMBAM